MAVHPQRALVLLRARAALGRRARPFIADIKAEEDFKFEQHHIDRLIVGGPEDCIEKIRQFQEVLDPDYLVMSFRVALGPSFEEELECVRRFGAR